MQTFEYGVCRTESTDNIATMLKTSSLTRHIKPSTENQSLQILYTVMTQWHCTIDWVKMPSIYSGCPGCLHRLCVTVWLRATIWRELMYGSS